jgi:23S rRNA pseudouridine2604 synthase
MQKINVKTSTPVRINKYIADAGMYSRRKADDLISKNKVHVNGSLISLGVKVKDKDIITILEDKGKNVYALYNKPRGEITGPINIFPNSLPVGRLDKESEGLLLYTNDFQVFDNLLNPKFAREREYEITIREKATPRVITLLKKGIETQEGVFDPVKEVLILNDGYKLRIILTEGKKHEIRRMLNALNLTIIQLIRTRIMNMRLGNLKSGEIKILNEKEEERLLRELDL